MKKFLLIAVLLSACSLSAQKTRYGVKAGINVSSLSGDVFDDASSRVGAAAGFFATIPVGGNFSFQPEFLYSGQGVKPDSGDNPVNQREELDYLQVPLLLRADFGNFYANLGPQVGIGVWNSFNNEAYKNFDYSGLLGVGMNFTDALFGEVRYSMGFRDIFEEGFRYNGNQVEGKNSYFQLMVGYRL
ncbi:MAG: hypothetical protein CL868_20750 [Cytophagaceae bacterium]|nr:hypothetical protein [Cytophagaceae bacterium]|tara:strand:+ start:617 stop:1177 length:561 start_codon:yes stop_codon:yes gene_type:complete